MPRIAIISDIHGNMSALTNVLKDIEAQKVDKIYCLGDVVGYGPEPVEAMKMVIDVCELGKVICGNHDHASIHEPIGFNAEARNAAIWTNKVIKAGIFGWFSGKGEALGLAQLAALELQGGRRPLHPREPAQQPRGVRARGAYPGPLLPRRGS